MTFGRPTTFAILFTTTVLLSLSSLVSGSISDVVDSSDASRRLRGNYGESHTQTKEARAEKAHEAEMSAVFKLAEALKEAKQQGNSLADTHKDKESAKTLAAKRNEARHKAREESAKFQAAQREAAKKAEAASSPLLNPAESKKEALKSKLGLLESQLGVSKETNTDGNNNKEAKKQESSVVNTAWGEKSAESKSSSSSSSLESLISHTKEALLEQEQEAATADEKEATTTTAAATSEADETEEEVVIIESVVCDTLCQVDGSFVCTSDLQTLVMENIHATLMEALVNKIACCATLVTVTDIVIVIESTTESDGTITLTDTSTLIFDVSSIYTITSCAVVVEGCNFTVPSGYDYDPNLVVADSGYEMVEGPFDPTAVSGVCDSDEDCAAFTTSGALLYSNYTADNYTDYCTGVFTQSSDTS